MNDSPLKEYTPAGTRLYVILVNMMIPLGGMSTDIYLPSLPAMSEHFHSPKAVVQLTVTVFAIAMGLSQFIAGPISDALGRKKLLLFSMFLQLLSVIGIIVSPFLSGILILRFLHGIAVAFLMVPARAILNDLFTGETLKKHYNYITISFAVSPIVAPFIGGYLQHYLGWKANFEFLLIIIVSLTCMVLFFYHETLKKRRLFSISHLWKNYQAILSHRFFLLCALFAGLTYTYAASFNITGPFLIQMTLHQSAVTYGHTALAMGFAWFLGNSLNRIFIKKDRTLKTTFALWCIFITAILMLLWSWGGHFTLPVLTVPTFILIMLSGLIFPIYIGESLIIFPKLAASANACVFGINWLMMGSFTIVATFLKVHSLIPLALLFVGYSMISLVFFYGLLSKHK